MVANVDVLGTITKAAPLLGITGGVAALAAVPNPEAKLFTCLLMFALAAGSAMRQALLAKPKPQPFGDYPFDARSANPWERDRGPVGL
jgi:hypothetical protein